MMNNNVQKSEFSLIHKIFPVKDPSPQKTLDDHAFENGIFILVYKNESKPSQNKLN